MSLKPALLIGRFGFIVFTLYTLCLIPYAFAQTEEPSSTPVEPPKQKTNINVKDNLLSVDLLDAEFSSVIRAIAEKANFKVEISGNVISRKITTNFKDLAIERGILRLLSLIGEKNYSINYDSKGLLSKLEIFGGSTIKKPQAGQQPASPSLRPGPTPKRPLPPSTPKPPPPPPPPLPTIEDLNDDDDEGL